MPDVKEVRRRFWLALIVLLALTVASSGVLISPIGTSADARQTQIQELWGTLRKKDREAIPLRGIDKKVVTAKEEVTGFWNSRLPSSYAMVSERLGKLASESGVTMAGSRYKAEPADVSGLQRVRIDAAISGDYVQIVKFINAIEREKTFFLINSIVLGEQQGGNVSLQIRMETFLKTA